MDAGDYADEVNIHLGDRIAWEPFMVVYVIILYSDSSSCGENLAGCADIIITLHLSHESYSVYY